MLNIYIFLIALLSCSPSDSLLSLIEIASFNKESIHSKNVRDILYVDDKYLVVSFYDRDKHLFLYNYKEHKIIGDVLHEINSKKKGLVISASKFRAWTKDDFLFIVDSDGFLQKIKIGDGLKILSTNDIKGSNKPNFSINYSLDEVGYFVEKVKSDSDGEDFINSKIAIMNKSGFNIIDDIYPSPIVSTKQTFDLLTSVVVTAFSPYYKKVVLSYQFYSSIFVIDLQTGGVQTIYLDPSFKLDNRLPKQGTNRKIEAIIEDVAVSKPYFVVAYTAENIFKALDHTLLVFYRWDGTKIGEQKINFQINKMNLSEDGRKIAIHSYKDDNVIKIYDVNYDI